MIHRRHPLNRLDEDIRDHIEREMQENIERGMAPEEARRQAMLAFGNISLVREDTRAVWVARWRDEIARDLHYAVRTLSKNPAFAVTAIATLALAIGASTAVFSVVYGLLLRPLPYRDADRLVIIEAYRAFAGRPEPTRWNYSYVDLEDWRSGGTAFDSFALVRAVTFAVGGDGRTEDLDGASVTSGFFETVGGPILLGRPIGSADRNNAVAVISERLWTNRFSRDADIIGRRMTLDGDPYSVIGVAGAAFQMPDEARDIWIPAEYHEAQRGPATQVRGRGGFNPVARLAPGVTLDQAQANADAVSRALSVAYPDAHGGLISTVIPLRSSLVGDTRPVLLVLLAAVGQLLAIACANVANLLVARGVNRAREVAIRTALGATRTQLVRQSLVDAGLLAASGCLAGVVVTYAVVRTLIWLEPPAISRLDAISVDVPVMLFAAAVATVVTLTIGLLPALQHTQGPEPLKAGAPATTQARGGRRAGRALAVVQLAAAVVLVVGTALLGRSLVQLLAIDIGVPSDRMAAMLIGVPFPEEDSVDADARSARMQALLSQLLDRIEQIPGVERAAVTQSLPPNFTRSRTSFMLANRATGEPEQHLVDLVPISAEFFETIRLPLLRGRRFTSEDARSDSRALILSAAAARRFFGSRDPIGLTIPVGLDRDGRGTRPDLTVIGVVGDVRYAGLQNEPLSTFYVPFDPWSQPNPFVVARTTGDPRDVLGAMRAAVADVDPQVSVAMTDTLEGLIGMSTAAPRFRALLLSTIAGLALVIAAVGVYGVIAYSVSRRTSEIGVRMALGAAPAEMARMVLREGLTLAALGIAIGLAVAYGVTGALERLLYGVTPTDGAAFALAAAVLMAITALACFVPARRAARVDPIVALRCE